MKVVVDIETLARVVKRINNVKKDLAYDEPQIDWFNQVRYALQDEFGTALVAAEALERQGVVR